MKNDNALNNQAPVPKNHSVDSPINNTTLTRMKIQIPYKLTIARLNVNSIRNKFDSLSFMTENNVDIILIWETKLDNSFPSGQIKILGFSMSYLRNRDSMGGGILSYILEMTFQLNSWSMFLELILKICQLKLIYEKESGFSMALTIGIKTKFRII